MPDPFCLDHCEVKSSSIFLEGRGAHPARAHMCVALWPDSPALTDGRRVPVGGGHAERNCGTGLTSTWKSPLSQVHCALLYFFPFCSISVGFFALYPFL